MRSVKKATTYINRVPSTTLATKTRVSRLVCKPAYQKPISWFETKRSGRPRSCISTERYAHLLMSRLSHTMRVSTAPRSSPLRVSSTMKQYLPVSWLISSKYFCSSRFSCNMHKKSYGTTGCSDEFSTTFVNTRNLSRILYPKASKLTAPGSIVRKIVGRSYRAGCNQRRITGEEMEAQSLC